MSTAKSGKIIPISDTQAAIGAGAIMSFFVLWALIAGVGDEFVCWIGGKDNLSGWVQAFGSIATIYYSLKVSRRQMDAQRRLQEEQLISERQVSAEKEKNDEISKKLRGYRSLFRRLASVQSRIGYIIHVIDIEKNLDARSILNSLRFISKQLSADSVIFGIGDEGVLDAIDRIKSLIMAIQDMLSESMARKSINDIDRRAFSKKMIEYSDNISGINSLAKLRVVEFIPARVLKQWQDQAKDLDVIFNLDDEKDK